MKEADEAEREIDETRSKYIPVAQRSSTLFFALLAKSVAEAKKS